MRGTSTGPYSLYVIETPLGSYVGVSKDASRRFSAHRISKRFCPLSDVIRHYDLRADSVRILAVGSRAYIYDLEFTAIAAFGTRWPLGFNIASGGYGCRDHLPSVRARMSARARAPDRIAALIARNKSPEMRAKVSTKGRGIRFAQPETIKKLSDSHKGQRPSGASVTRRAASMRATRAERAAIACLSFGS